MSNSRSIATLWLSGALVWGATAAAASDAHSSPEDRARFVSVTRGLEQAPLRPASREDREWALAWLTEVPDIDVDICADMLGGLLRGHYPYAAEILLQDSFSTAAFIIEHPETAEDKVRQQRAGVEGALTAYRSILRDRPEAKSPDLEALLQTQSRGELPEFVRKAWVSCSAKK